LQQRAHLPQRRHRETLCEGLEHYQGALEWPALEHAELVAGYGPSDRYIEEAF
jgi:hypothetical protein